MNRLWRIPSAVADLTLGTVIVLVQLTLQAREQARHPAQLPPPKRTHARA
jgi:hypothetical protein